MLFYLFSCYKYILTLTNIIITLRILDTEWGMCLFIVSYPFIWKIFYFGENYAMKDSHLSDLYVGKHADTIKMKAEGWHDQGSADYHYGLKKGKNLWVRKFDPAEKSCCHTVWLFVMLQLESDNTIKSVGTDVHQVFNDGSFESLGIPFFPHDYDMVKKHLNDIVIDDGKVRLPEQVPLDMQKFIDIIGKGLSSPAVKALAKTYSMRESLGYALMDAGRFLMSDDKRIEIQFDLTHRVSTIFLKSFAEDDVLLGGITSKSTKAMVRKKLGPPTSSADDGWWDRFDNDTYKLHFQYVKNRINQITIMAPSAAP